MTDLIDRLVEKIDFTEECWVWTGATRPGRGSIYGVIHVSSASRGSRMEQAHRVAYEVSVAGIPDDLQLDHLCKNGLCVNPDHLDPVTPRVNKLRGPGFAAENASKVECSRGHALSEWNLTPYSKRNGWRKCLSCSRAHGRGHRANEAAFQRVADSIYASLMVGSEVQP